MGTQVFIDSYVSRFLLRQKSILCHLMSVLKNAKRRQSFKLEGEEWGGGDRCFDYSNNRKLWTNIVRFESIKRLTTDEVCEIRGFVKIMFWRFNWHVLKFDWVVNDVMKRCEMRDCLSSLKWPLCFLLQCRIVLPWFLCRGGHDGEASCYLLVWYLMKWWFPLGSWPNRLSYLKLICQ